MALLTVSLLPACGTACPGIKRPSFSITVVGGAEESGDADMGGSNGVAECAATIIISQGASQEELSCFGGSDGNCRCDASPHLNAEVTVTVTLGDETEVQTTDLQYDKCGPETVDLCFFGDC